jgi:hypothetical protein
VEGGFCFALRRSLRLFYCPTLRARLYFRYRRAECSLETVNSAIEVCAQGHRRRIKRYGSTRN